MSISVTFSIPRDSTPAKGSAGLPTQVGGTPTTVSAYRLAGEAIGNKKFIKASKG